VAWLRRAGLGPLAAEALEAFSPLTIVGAQLAYLSAPFIRGMGEVGRLLDDPARLIGLLQHEDSDR
jgi:hypothetical protein